MSFITAKTQEILRNFFLKSHISKECTIKIQNLLERYFAGEIFPTESIVQNFKFDNKMKNIPENLLKIPYSRTISYQDFTKMCKLGNAVRHVATIIGKNPLPVVIPCHRVIKKSGETGNYLLGIDVKIELIEFEKSNLSHVD